MQDITQYAAKYGITLDDYGDCQFCGCPASRGVFECHENMYRTSELLDFSNSTYYQTRFLSVDAMALQHSEIHGPWNNHIHLTRLHLIFEKDIKWDYAKTPILSNVINEYKRDRREFLPPPPLKQRGEMTSSDIVNARDSSDCMQLVQSWAYAVYRAYFSHHDIAAKLSAKFLAKMQ
jgi:hypothetical protein